MLWKPNKFDLVRGQPAKLAVVFLDDEADSIQLQGITAITLRVKNADQTILSKSAIDGYTMGNPPKQTWIYGFNLTAEEIDALPLALNQDIEVVMTFGDRSSYQIYKKALSIFDKQI